VDLTLDFANIMAAKIKVLVQTKTSCLFRRSAIRHVEFEATDVGSFVILNFRKGGDFIELFVLK
jgi:hypothetical protein